MFKKPAEDAARIIKRNTTIEIVLVGTLFLFFGICYMAGALPIPLFLYLNSDNAALSRIFCGLGVWLVGFILCWRIWASVLYKLAIMEACAHIMKFNPEAQDMGYFDDEYFTMTEENAQRCFSSWYNNRKDSFMFYITYSKVKQAVDFCIVCGDMASSMIYPNVTNFYQSFTNSISGRNINEINFGRSVNNALARLYNANLSGKYCRISDKDSSGVYDSDFIHDPNGIIKDIGELADTTKIFYTNTGIQFYVAVEDYDNNKYTH